MRRGRGSEAPLACLDLLPRVLSRVALTALTGLVLTACSLWTSVEEHAEPPRGLWEIFTVRVDGSQETQITHNEFWDALPAWSPSGNRIAFVSDRDGDAEIYVMQADGTRPIQLTHNRLVDTEPTWSSDGSSIALVRHLPNEGEPFENSEIVVVAADGSNESRLTTNSLRDESPAWSPDGSHLAFLRGDGVMRAFVMRFDGTEVTQVSTISADAPTWSPDGTRLLLSGYAHGGPPDLYVADLSRSSLTRLTTNPGPDSDPAWSPSGSSVAFSSSTDVQEPTGIFLVRSDGSSLIRLTESGHGDEAPAWSPDGRQLLFIRRSNGEDSDIYLVNPDGSGLARLTNGPASEGAPTFSPDGTRVAFMSPRMD
jgi:Tol biopolymer transport system component